ncbi:hypothetical protein Q8A67_020268 [Cirrhinus molitorella]|uniref:Uncharacterized protein n=1 Tax=Cirrhinus molitorella TaxID=172907 RepID=A0AA88TNI6_9TELE|nr:hypothetical protein Q8A67_020268 [Cirrhinus molitorella]
MLPRYVGSGQAVVALMSVAGRITQSLIYSSEPQSGFSIGGCSGQLLTKHSRDVALHHDPKAHAKPTQTHRSPRPENKELEMHTNTPTGTRTQPAESPTTAVAARKFSDLRKPPIVNSLSQGPRSH